MPVSMKIQPIDGVVSGGDRPEVVAAPPATAAKAVVRSRLKRLFRISVAEKDFPPPSAAVSGEVFEPSSVCLAKMVQNFIEESNERHQSPAQKCGRNRCNCFNGDNSDDESDGISAGDVSDFLKSLVGSGSMNERNVLGETARIVGEKSKGCKRKDEMRKVVTEGLVALGYDAAICKSKWEKSPSFPAGEYEYVDVIIGGERLIIDTDFRSEFEVARSTKTYKSILQILPQIFVGKSDRLSKIICILSEAAKQSLKKKGMPIPPWRKADYVQAKWLSPPTRLTLGPGPLTQPVGPRPNKETEPPPPTNDQKDMHESEHKQCDEVEPGNNSPQFESLFEMSESSSGEEETKVKKNKEKQNQKQKNKKIFQINPMRGSKPGVKIVTGLASIMEEKP